MWPCAQWMLCHARVALLQARLTRHCMSAQH